MLAGSQYKAEPRAKLFAKKLGGKREVYPLCFVGVPWYVDCGAYGFEFASRGEPKMLCTMGAKVGLSELNQVLGLVAEVMEEFPDDSN